MTRQARRPGRPWRGCQPGGGRARPARTVGARRPPPSHRHRIGPRGARSLPRRSRQSTKPRPVAPPARDTNSRSPGQPGRGPLFRLDGRPAPRPRVFHRDVGLRRPRGRSRAAARASRAEARGERAEGPRAIDRRHHAHHRLATAPNKPLGSRARPAPHRQIWRIFRFAAVNSSSVRIPSAWSFASPCSRSVSDAVDGWVGARDAAGARPCGGGGGGIVGAGRTTWWPDCATPSARQNRSTRVP